MDTTTATATVTALDDLDRYTAALAQADHERAAVTAEHDAAMTALDDIPRLIAAAIINGDPIGDYLDDYVTADRTRAFAESKHRAIDDAIALLLERGTMIRAALRPPRTERIDGSYFEQRWGNDHADAPTVDPRTLLKTQ